MKISLNSIWNKGAQYLDLAHRTASARIALNHCSLKFYQDIDADEESGEIKPDICTDGLARVDLMDLPLTEMHAPKKHSSTRHAVDVLLHEGEIDFVQTAKALQV